MKDTSMPLSGSLYKYAPWLALVIVILLAPILFPERSMVTTFSYLGIMAIFALSYNILLGQTGLLSLGHGTFYGLGGFFTVHAILFFTSKGIEVPLPILPLVGGLGGLLFGYLGGLIASGRGGMPFAMITLGLGELIYSGSFLFPNFFGGEEGMSIDRMDMGEFLGFGFGAEIEIYYIVAGWFLISALCMYFLTQTPFGALSNAARDNAERVEFLGFQPSKIRLRAFTIAAGFAGIAGGLAAINFEIVTLYELGASNSTLVLLMTYIGGTGLFLGPALGAVVIGMMKIWLSDITPAWLLYFGLLFIFVVMYAPRGLAGIISDSWSFIRSDNFTKLFSSAALVGISGLVLAFGLSMLIEMGYRVGLDAQLGPEMVFIGIPLNTSAVWPWGLAIGLILFGSVLIKYTLEQYKTRHHELENKNSIGVKP